MLTLQHSSRRGDHVHGHWSSIHRLGTNPSAFWGTVIAGGQSWKIVSLTIRTIIYQLYYEQSLHFQQKVGIWTKHHWYVKQNVQRPNHWYVTLEYFRHLVYCSSFKPWNATIPCFSCWDGHTEKLQRFSTRNGWLLPMVAIENGHRNRGFTHWKWCMISGWWFGTELWKITIFNG